MFDRIQIDPAVCEGKATIRGLRITVEFVLKLLGDGYTAKETVDLYPEMEEGYAVSLERRKLYRVIPDAEAAGRGQLRVVDESGEDYLYPKEFFVRVTLPEAVERAVLDAV
ncbi:MAG: DUF433 domain-containing protein [Chloroflexi bacterium]|nr:DUF433 domain-containing protein [Chloroflexota bacterium]